MRVLAIQGKRDADIGIFPISIFLMTEKLLHLKLQMHFNYRETIFGSEIYK